MRLENIQSPKDIKNLTDDELKELANEIRSVLIETVAQRGGHLASNLGIVELTLALHRVFDAPKDKIIFDVGHQSYVHKLLTGRYRRFHTLRSFGGLSGFPKRCESEYDVFETGHSSTAISAAVGLARARDYHHENHHVIAVVGDGAFTGGMCYEALNDAGNDKTNLIVILNDNGMSIAPNVGGFSRHLTDLRSSKGWASTKKAVQKVKQVPFVGKPIYHLLRWAKDAIKSFWIDEGFFEALDVQYLGPIDGHDMRSLEKTLRRAKESEGPVLIHVMTKKGFGYEIAEKKPEQFHGVAPFVVETGDVRIPSTLPSYGKVMAQTLSEIADSDDRIVTITAAMPSGTGLSIFAEKYPERMLDVGIAEEHAATMAAGLATGGMKPYFAVYTSFFQRCYDQMLHDVCMQHLPVTFLLDRAGLVGQDGSTHHGVFDLSTLLPIPGLTVIAPMDICELQAMLRWSVDFDGPIAIRYGRESADLSHIFKIEQFTPGKWQILQEGKDCALLAVGSMVGEAVTTAKVLA